MTWKIVNNSDAGDSTHFGGNDTDKINNMFGGVDVSDTVLIHANVTWTFSGITTFNANIALGSNDLNTTGRIKENSINISPIGKHDIYVDAGGVIPVDSGALATRIVDSGVDQKAFAYIPFVSGSVTFATIKIVLPRTYNLGTLTAVVEWTSETEGSGTVEWDISACAIGDGEDMSTVVYGTAQNCDDTQLTINQVQTTSRCTAITIGNTPVDGNVIFVKISRNGTGDTFGEDAQLLGIWFELETDLAVSA